jgi:hypothetical protein
MTVFRCPIACAVLVLLGGLLPARGADEVLVPGDPPLTDGLLGKNIWMMEWVLDLKLTEPQRREFKGLYVESWKKLDKGERKKTARSVEEGRETLSRLSPYHLNKLRLATQPAWLANWRKPGAFAPNRWLADLHEETTKPGGSNNAVLVPGDPALTQLSVNRYGDYVEWVLDFSTSGGLTAAQRKVLKDYLVKDWKKMDRDAFLATVKEWVEVAAQKPEVWRKWTEAERPKLLAQLYTARDDERSRWLLETFTLERKKLDLMNEAERKRHEAMMQLIDNLKGSGGSYRFNPVKGQYEWVPGR